MYYQQAIYTKADRTETAKALLREHFKRVEKEPGAEFGDIEFDPLRYFNPALRVLSAHAEVKKDFERQASACSEIEVALMESMWSTLH